ncbi:MAG TPA: ATP-grasp domain-containing protein [Candidatus Nanoarchaeia archaeon]|nr:ATP-grasp domain-containing protein [Candidatus Nanoarchaeia archaeon]
MKILIYEYVSGGGFAGQPLAPSLLSEGFAMLRGLTTDFKVAGHEVTVLLDSRLADFSPPLAADRVVWVSEVDSAALIMKQAAESNDGVFIVAPEGRRTLQKLVECTESSNVNALNSTSAAIEQAADKAALAKRLKDLGLNSPKTLVFSANDSVDEIARITEDQIGFPSVFKPSNGAGCSGMSVVRSAKQVLQAVENMKADPLGDVIVQEFVEGASASVSLMVAGAKALPVSLNLQDITLAPPEGVSSYNGGLVPFDHPLKDEAFEMAKRLAESFGNLRGYVGVDVVLSDKGVFVVEVNPRLTTSYVGLRRVADFNVAEAITDVALKNTLPDCTQPIGVSCFSKIPVSRPVMFAWQDFLRMEELISPPFPIANQEISYAILQSYGDRTEIALRNLSEAKERLRETWMRGQNPW